MYKFEQMSMGDTIELAKDSKFLKRGDALQGTVTALSNLHITYIPVGSKEERVVRRAALILDSANLRANPKYWKFE